MGKGEEVKGGEERGGEMKLDRERGEGRGERNREGEEKADGGGVRDGREGGMEGREGWGR